MSEHPFWFVLNPDGRAPRYRHTSEKSARDEAERLARNNPGVTFIVLKAVASVRSVDVQWTEYDPDSDLPF